MKQRGRQPASRTVSIDPELERRWQEALQERPTDADPTGLAVWDAKYASLLSAYQDAVGQARRREQERLATAQRREEQLRSARIRFRRRLVAAVVGIALAIGGLAYWHSRPSADELRERAAQRVDAACDAHYSQAHHVKLVTKQIDLLADGEGGWVDLTAYPGQAPTLGGVDLSPAELQAGKAGHAQVNREAYVDDSTLGAGSSVFLERRDGRLVVTFFAYASGYVDLPHAPLAATMSATATVYGEQLSPVCWQQ